MWWNYPSSGHIVAWWSWRENTKIWFKTKKEIVFKGNYTKFSQNAELKTYLLSTKGKVLAEASPYDKVWGIGLNIDDEMRFNMTKWRGKNLLGEVLMQVRAALK